MEVKGKKSYKNKDPSPRKQNRMLCAIIRHQYGIIHRSTRFKSSLLHFNELDIDNNHLSTNAEYNDHSILNFHFTPNEVNYTTNLLDVVLTVVVLRPTKKQGV